MEPPQRSSVRLPANSWDREVPEAVNAISGAAYAPDSAVTSVALPHVAAPVAASRQGKEAVPSKAKELIRLALLLRLPGRAATSSVDRYSATGRISVAANCSSRASSANSGTLHQCGSSRLAGASAAPPPAAAAAATEAAAGTMRHSPRALQPQRISSGTAVASAALAAARQRVLEKQQQLLHYLDCIAAGDLLLRDIQQQQKRPKAPTAFSRMMGVLPEQVQHPDELRYHRQQELLQLLQGRSVVQKKRNQQALSRRQQQQQQRLKGTRRQLPTSALQLLYFRLQRKVERLELLHERQSCTQQQHRAPAKLNVQDQKYQREELNQEHRKQQRQQQQQCQQRLQQEHQKHLEQQQPQGQLQRGQAQRPAWGQQQQQVIRPAAQQDHQDLTQHGFGGNTFLTACEDTDRTPPFPAAVVSADVPVTDRAKTDALTPVSVANATAAGVAAASSSAAQICAGATPLQAVEEATNGPVAAAAGSPSPVAADHADFAPDATTALTGVTATAAMGADTATSAASSDAPIEAAAAHLHLPEAPSTLSRRFINQNSNWQSLMQLRPTKPQLQQQFRRNRLLDGQIDAFRRLLELSKCATLLFKH